MNVSFDIRAQRRKGARAQRRKGARAQTTFAKATVVDGHKGGRMLNYMKPPAIFQVL